MWSAIKIRSGVGALGCRGGVVGVWGGGVGGGGFFFNDTATTEIYTLSLHDALPISSAQPNKEKVGKVTKAQVKEIVQIKMKDLNAADMEGAMKIVEGTARSMGIEVTDRTD